MKLAALALACGCGRLGFDVVASPDAGADGPSIISGTRLRAERWVTDDGVATFADWYDTQLDVRCRFTADVNGTLRCFPSVALVDAYSDSTCTTPAIRVPAGCGTAATVASNGAAAYALGATLGVGYLGGSGTCIAATDGASYYQVGAAVTETMFVSATYVPSASGGGITAFDLVADDGSRAFDHLTADITGTRCDPRAGSCQPQAQYQNEVTNLYSDPGCATEVSPKSATMPYLALYKALAPCAGTRLVAPSGPMMFVATTYFRDITGACVSTQAAGNVVPIHDVPGVPTLARAIDPGTTRLRTTAWITSTGERFLGRLFDTQLGMACDPVTDTSDRTTCMPIGVAALLDGFTSANCSGTEQAVDVECDGGDSIAEFALSAATCEGRGFALDTHKAPVTIQTSAASAGGCIAVDSTGARMFPSAEATPYDPARTVPMLLVRD